MSEQHTMARHRSRTGEVAAPGPGHNDRHLVVAGHSDGFVVRLKRVPGEAAALVNRLCDDARTRPVRAVRVLGIVVVGFAVLAGAMWFATQHFQATAQARTSAMAEAESSVVDLMSYNYRTIDDHVSETAGLLTGDFKDSYARLMRTVAPKAKGAQVSVQTSVLNDSVVSSSPDQVVLLMFVNQQSESTADPDAQLGGSRLQVTLRHEQGKWLISQVDPV